MTLGPLQRGIEQLYAVETGLDVDDFLVDAADLPDVALRTRGETLLLRQEEDGSASVGLWVDAVSLDRLRAAPARRWIDPDLLPDFCKALEGVSHFVYLAWRAAEERPVSLFDLELQAEVDKFVAGTLLAREGGAGPSEIEGLRARLFDDVEFIDGEDGDPGARYRRASGLAARLAARLAEPLSRPSGRAATFGRLRRFYRLGGEEKVREIDR